MKHRTKRKIAQSAAMMFAIVIASVGVLGACGQYDSVRDYEEAQVLALLGGESNE